MSVDARDIKTICLHCFGTLNQRGFCPVCQKKANDKETSPLALPLRTLLSNRYLLSKPLGVGGFGVTYLGWDLTASRRVAVKEFFPKGFATRDAKSGKVNVTGPKEIASFNHWRKAFVQEAQILMRINHLHGVVRLLDFFEANNTAYIVMDFLDGVSLHKYLTTHGRKLSVADALKIVRPVLDSLVVLHQYGVIHKDISPENIMIVQNKYVKLIDFGAASLFKQGNTEKPFMVLKAGYSPIELYKPEQYKQGPWSDVYQMGATIYNCITGYIPADAPTRMTNDLLPRPTALGAKIPIAVENALMKSLQILPEDRYANVGDFIQMLYGEFMPTWRK